MFLKILDIEMTSISHCIVLKYCHWVIKSACDLELLLKYLGLPVYIVIVLSLELVVLDLKVSIKVAVEIQYLLILVSFV